MDQYLPAGFNEIFETATKQLALDGRVKALLAAYDRALEDPRFFAPTSFHAAIEALRRK